MTPALELRGIHKHFGSVHALAGADFSLEPGEVHALLGENGAGKSTLMNIAAGLLRPDRGEILIGGIGAAQGSPRDAARLGIGMVHQHFTSVPAFTVAENIALAAGWAARPAGIRRKVAELTERLGLGLDPDALAGSLPIALLQRLELLKALARGAAILLFDEPTGSLAPEESEELLQLVGRLVAQGASAVLVTHKLDEALRHANRLTVLRQGMVTLRGNAREFAVADVARAMLGEDLPPRRRPERPTPGSVVVRADRLTVRPMGGHGPGVVEATFLLRAGEVVGVAGVQGNGERELMRAVAGLVRPESGTLEVSGPVAFVPENRTTEGIIPEFSLTDNLTLGLGNAAPWVRRGLLDRALAKTATAQLIEEHRIVAPGPEVAAVSLSGGNQQKLILARALELRPRVLVAESPARGLDVRAAQSAFDRVSLAAVRGAGVMMYSSDLDELIGVCDRILVMSGGQLREAALNADRQTIGRMLLGVHPS